MKFEEFISLVKNLPTGTLIIVDHMHAATQYRHQYQGTFGGVTEDGRAKVLGKPTHTDRSYDSGVRYIHFSDIINIEVLRPDEIEDNNKMQSTSGSFLASM